MSLIGYARSKTDDQAFSIQVAKLKDAGCDIVRYDSSFGTRDDGQGRTELASVIEFMRDGDELVVVRLECLGRSTRDALRLIQTLADKGACLRVLEPAVSTAGDMGQVVITVLGMAADMEQAFASDKRQAGNAAAKGYGTYRGRRKPVDGSEIRRLASEGMSKAQIARDLGVSRMTVYRALDVEKIQAALGDHH